MEAVEGRRESELTLRVWRLAEMRIGDEGKIWEGQYIRERLQKMPGD